MICLQTISSLSAFLWVPYLGVRIFGPPVWASCKFLTQKLRTFEIGASARVAYEFVLHFWVQYKYKWVALLLLLLLWDEDCYKMNEVLWLPTMLTTKMDHSVGLQRWRRQEWTKVYNTNDDNDKFKPKNVLDKSDDDNG